MKYWEYKVESWKTRRHAAPNRIHEAVVQIEKIDRMEMLVTQNVDGLHSRAGTSPEKLVELHGTDLLVECQKCLERSDPEPHFRYFEEQRRPPVCPCGGILKPATISFGQSLRQDDLDRAALAAGAADLVVALGSTLSVTPAASIPLLAARRGIPYVIINRGVTDHDAMAEVSLRLEGDVNEIFPAAVEEAFF